MDHHCKTPMPKLPRWNWAAFLLTFIWGAGNRVWISLLAVIPGIGLIMAVILGLKGNEWAWRANPCLNREEFLKAQKLWFKWSLIVYIIVFVFGFVFLYYSSYELKRLDEIATRDAERIVEVRTLVSNINRYKLSHDQICPQNLSDLVPDYLTELPTGPGGDIYSYTFSEKDCQVSAVLEDAGNANLKTDSNPQNGNIYDDKAEDISKLQNLSD